MSKMAMSTVHNHLDTVKLLCDRLEGQQTNDGLDWNGHHQAPALLLAYAQSELQQACAELERIRLTCFGLPVPM